MLYSFLICSHYWKSTNSSVLGVMHYRTYKCVSVMDLPARQTSLEEYLSILGRKTHVCFILQNTAFKYVPSLSSLQSKASNLKAKPRGTTDYFNFYTLFSEKQNGSD